MRSVAFSICRFRSEFCLRLLFLLFYDFNLLPTFLKFAISSLILTSKDSYPTGSQPHANASILLFDQLARYFRDDGGNLKPRIFSI